MLFPHEREIRFNSITMEEGLSQNSVSAIVQDKEGFLWFGTQEGLNRYDGKNFTAFYRNPFDSNSLSSNMVQSLYMEEETLWVGTYKGLNRMNIHSGRVDRFSYDEENSNSLSNDVVTTICRDSRGDLWVGTLKGLNRFNEEEGGFTRYFHQPEEETSLPHDVIRSVYEDGEGRLWIGSYGGLSLYDPLTDSFSSPVEDLPSLYVMDILSDRDGSLLLGIWGAGLCWVNTESYEFEEIPFPDDRIYKVLPTDDSIWIASYGGGLIQYIREDQSVLLHNSASPSSSPLSNDTVYSLYEDPSGILWVGTNGGGIQRIIPGWERFDLWSNRGEKSPYTEGNIQGIFQDRNKDIWVSIYNKGLDRLNQNGEFLGHYSHDTSDPHSISDDLVQFVFQDSRGRIWVGTNTRLNRYIPETDSFVSNRESLGLELPEEDIIVFSIEEDDKGQLWLGTYNQGMICFSSEGRLLQRFSRDDGSGLSDNLIRRLLISSDGTLWAGTNNGLNRYDPESKTFKAYYHNQDNLEGLSSDEIHDLFEDHRGTLWIGTSGGGLNYYQKDKDSFQQYSLGEQSYAMTILGIEEDPLGNLWVSSHQGLKKISSDRNQVNEVESTLGFPKVQLTLGSLKNNKGELLFGSSSGVVLVQPFEANAEVQDSKLILTSFKAMGVSYRDEEPPYLQSEITLDYRDSLIEFEFADLNYLSGLSSNYSYRLEGFEENWHFTGERRTGSYSNLKAGKYNLIIRSLRYTGETQVTAGELVIPIHLPPPPWRTLPAIFLYLLLGFALVLSVINRVKKQQLKQYEELENERRFKEELEKQVQERTLDLKNAVSKQEEMAEMLAQSEKLSAIGQLAGGVAHDFNNQLQGIIGFTERLMLEDHSEEHQSFLNNILMSANNAAELTGKLLAFARKGNKSFSEVSLQDIIHEVASIFEHSIDKKIELICEFEQKLPLLSGDRTQLQNAILNILLNSKDAISGKGKIQVYCGLKNLMVEIKGVLGERIPRGNYLLLKIEDSGSGIDPSLINRIFEPFFTTKDVTKGTGMGLAAVYGTVKSHNGFLRVDSELGRGTTFSLFFPVNKKL